MFSPKNIFFLYNNTEIMKNGKKLHFMTMVRNLIFAFLTMKLNFWIICIVRKSINNETTHFAHCKFTSEF